MRIRLHARSMHGAPRRGPGKLCNYETLRGAHVLFTSGRRHLLHVFFLRVVIMFTGRSLYRLVHGSRNLRACLRATLLHTSCIVRQADGACIRRSVRKPQEPEPEDCCGNGCKDCVWVDYEKAVEEWRAAQGSPSTPAEDNGERPAEVRAPVDDQTHESSEQNSGNVVLPPDVESTGSS